MRYTPSGSVQDPQVAAELLQISRATAGDDEDSEDAWAELIEYLRVAAQLTYEELAEFREPAEIMPRIESATVH